MSSTKRDISLSFGFTSDDQRCFVRLWLDTIVSNVKLDLFIDILIDAE